MRRPGHGLGRYVAPRTCWCRVCDVRRSIYFPDITKVSPKFVQQFLGPCLPGVFEVALAVSVVLLLVADYGVGDSATEKVLPSDRLLGVDARNIG